MPPARLKRSARRGIGGIHGGKGEPLRVERGRRPERSEVERTESGAMGGGCDKQTNKKKGTKRARKTDGGGDGEKRGLLTGVDETGPDGSYKEGTGSLGGKTHSIKD